MALEETSFDILRRNTDLDCVRAEKEYVLEMAHVNYDAPFYWNTGAIIGLSYFNSVGIIREEGSNGDREMAFAFYDAGFNVHDVNMVDIKKNPLILRQFIGIVFVGGFSYADALGAGVGWSAAIKSNPTVAAEFDNFKNRSDTFSLGVCNGCQLLTQLGWVNAKMERNDSKRFESRYSTVCIRDTNSILLKGMEGGVLGVWVAHGEGKFTNIDSSNSVPVHYADVNGKSTMRYPENPNGSDRCAAAVCSPDGRHLAIMPHPERCVLNWQNPYVPKEWRKNKYYPWKQMFAPMRTNTVKTYLNKILYIYYNLDECVLL